VKRESIIFVTVVAFDQNLGVAPERFVNQGWDTVKHSKWWPCARFAITENRSRLLFGRKFPTAFSSRSRQLRPVNFFIGWKYSHKVLAIRVFQKDRFGDISALCMYGIGTP